jgi:hypothetical protein
MNPFFVQSIAINGRIAGNSVSVSLRDQVMNCGRNVFAQIFIVHRCTREQRFNQKTTDEK